MRAEVRADSRKRVAHERPPRRSHDSRSLIPAASFERRRHARAAAAGELQVRAEKGRAKFGDQLFHRVAVGAVALATFEAAVQTLFMRCPVYGFVTERRVVCHCVLEGRDRRQLDMIAFAGIVGLDTAVAQLDTGGSKERIGLCIAKGGSSRGGAVTG